MQTKTTILKSGIEFTEPIGFGNICCVYTLWIDDKYFYIGSTAQLKKRVFLFRSDAHNRKMSSKLLNNAAKDCKKIKIDIIKVFIIYDDAIRYEDFLIKEKHNAFCLNRSLCAYSVKGIVWTHEERLATINKLKGKKQPWSVIKNMRKAHINILYAKNISTNKKSRYNSVVSASKWTGISGYYIYKSLKTGNPTKQGILFTR